MALEGMVDSRFLFPAVRDRIDEDVVAVALLLMLLRPDNLPFAPIPP